MASLRSLRSLVAKLLLPHSLFRPFQRVAVFPLEAVAGGDGRFAVVILPHLMIARLARLAAQGMLLQNGALVIAIYFHKPHLLVSVQAVGQNDQYLPYRPFHNLINPGRIIEPNPAGVNAGLYQPLKFHIWNL